MTTNFFPVLCARNVPPPHFQIRSGATGDKPSAWSVNTQSSIIYHGPVNQQTAIFKIAFRANIKP